MLDFSLVEILIVFQEPNENGGAFITEEKRQVVLTPNIGL